MFFWGLVVFGIELRVLSSAGRVPPLHGEGRGFDPLSTHHFVPDRRCIRQLSKNEDRLKVVVKNKHILLSSLDSRFRGNDRNGGAVVQFG